MKLFRSNTIPRAALLFILSSVFFFGFQKGSDYKTLHFKSLVVDTHNDVVQRILAGEDISRKTKHGQSDLPRFKAGGLDVEMFSIWVPPGRMNRSYYDQADEQIDSIISFTKKDTSAISFCTSTNEVVQANKRGKFVAMLGMEGGHPMGNDIKNLRHFYQRGVRYMTLTWNNSTDWATSAADEEDPSLHLSHKGLTDLGKQIVQTMNEIGMMVDVSHVGEKTFWDVMATTTKPVIASHSSAWTLCHHRRNLKDAQLKAIAKNGGVVFINFAPWFIDSTFGEKETVLRRKNKAFIDSLQNTLKFDDFIKDMRIAEALAKEYKPIRPTLKQLIDHFDYVAKLIGTDHVGIGSDFDGITVTPSDMDDVTFLPNITRELLKRGYSESDVKKILGENFLRVLKANEKK